MDIHSIVPNMPPEKSPGLKENVKPDTDPYDLDLDVQQAPDKGGPIKHCSTESCACKTPNCTHTCTCACGR